MENNKYILAKYDVSGIQSYIFATNRLRENAGASFQVTRVLDEFLPEAFREAALLSDVKVLTDWKEADQLQLPEHSEAMAELIYIGGGNAMALFRDRELFRKVGQLLGIKVAHNCMGIDVAAASIDTDLSDFAADRDKLDLEMEDRKSVV